MYSTISKEKMRRFTIEKKKVDLICLDPTQTIQFVGKNKRSITHYVLNHKSLSRNHWDQEKPHMCPQTK